MQETQILVHFRTSQNWVAMHLNLGFLHLNLSFNTWSPIQNFTENIVITF